MNLNVLPDSGISIEADKPMDIDTVPIPVNNVDYSDSDSSLAEPPDEILEQTPIKKQETAMQKWLNWLLIALILIIIVKIFIEEAHGMSL